MQPRKGHSRLRHPGDICTHTQIHESSYCNKTHARTQTHGLWKNRPCILTVWVAYASRVFLFFLFLFVERVALGIRRGITGLILSQGCRLLPLKFPPPQMKVAVEVEDGMQVFQLLTSSKLFFSFLFFDLLSGNCKSQVADSPVYEPSRCISPLMGAALWPDKPALFPTNGF